MRGTIILLLLFALSCEMGFEAQGLFETNGLYECLPGEGFIGRTYTFNSLDSTTVIFRHFGIGDVSRLRFVDIETGDLIDLYTENPFRYKCSCVETK